MNLDEADNEPRQPLVDDLTEGAPPDSTASEWERVAAAAHAGLLRECRMEPLPAELEAKLRLGYAQFANEDGRVARPSFRRGAVAGSGWLAAAAAVALAGWLWLDSSRSSPADASSLAARLQRVEAAPDVVRLPLSPGSAGEGQAGGEVVWSTERQEGFLRLRGVRFNNPFETQYQLWIVDPLRDPKFPVDAGVFDVAGEDVLVPIDAKLRILSPKAFVVTREQPGGVVKSEAKEPVLLAAWK